MASKQRLYHDFRHIKKAAFLANFRELGNIRLAAESAGVDRTTFYKWCEHDTEFTLAYQQAKQDAVESLEAEARRRAVTGTVREKGVFHDGEMIATEKITEYSDTLLIFLLKGAAPEKYRENINVTQTQVTKAVDAAFWDAV